MPSKKTGFSKTSKPYSKGGKAGAKAAKGTSVSEKTSTFGKAPSRKSKTAAAGRAGTLSRSTATKTAKKTAKNGISIYKRKNPTPPSPKPKPGRK